MQLTEKHVSSAKPKERPYKMFDTEGLFLLVQPNGAKLWRLKYRFNGKEKSLAIGRYGVVSLAQARRLRAQARIAIAEGRDPSAERQLRKREHRLTAADTLEVVATEWHENHKHAWSAEYSSWVLRALKADVFPWLGRRPIVEIEGPEVLQAIRRIESRNALVTAHRVRNNLEQVFAYAIAVGRARRNPAADVRCALKPAPGKRHHPSVKDPKAVGELLRAIAGYQGSNITRAALQLAPLVFVRPGELRKAEWSEFDVQRLLSEDPTGLEWRIPAERMKMGAPHIVPLSRQAIAILRDLYPLTGGGKYVFPGVRQRSEPMSENTLNAALRRLNYAKDEMTAHGFRSMASTLLNEAGWNRDAIERQLAHGEKDKVRAAYNAALHLPERRRMLQAYADYLHGLAAGNENVTAVRKAA